MHGLRAGRTQRLGAKAQLLSDVQRDRRWAVVRDRDLLRQRAGHRAGVGGVEDDAQIRQAHGRVGRSAVLDERDVDCPVLAAGSELLGAVERVDDPHAILAQALRVVGGLLGEEAIIGAVLLKHAGDPVLCEVIARVAQGATAQNTHVTDALEDLTGTLSQALGQSCIVKLCSHNTRV